MLNNDKRQRQYEQFKALHQRTEAFVMPNAWDAGSAKILTALGYEALGTTSAGFAFASGKRDSCGSFSCDEILDNAGTIAKSTGLPVSADLEAGFGASPETCANTIKKAGSAGLVGGSIEDATGNSTAPIYPFAQAVERIHAAAEQARQSNIVLTARAENYLWGKPDFDDTLKRLIAFADAGADVLYAPGLPDLQAIETVCQALDKPVNVVMGLSGPSWTVDELQAAGVKRISTGGSLARAALGEFVRAASEIKNHGSFGYASNALPDATAAAYMDSADD